MPRLSFLLLLAVVGLLAFAAEADSASKTLAPLRSTSFATRLGISDEQYSQQAHEQLHDQRSTSFIEAGVGYLIEGPGGVKHPIHELLTVRAAEVAGFFDETYPDEGGKGDSCAWTGKKPRGIRFSRSNCGAYELKSNQRYQDLTRGAMWNDDPLGQFFESGERFKYSLTGAAAWYQLFLKCKKNANLPADKRDSTITNNVLCRSHFGDLAFIHGQDDPETSPRKTVSKMIRWAAFCYEVAIGKIPGTTQLGSGLLKKHHLLSGFKEETENGITVNELFGIKSKQEGNVRFRAAGSIAHMIEDCFAAGHCRRLCKDTKKPADGQTRSGDIIQFTAYANQDGKMHGKYDTWDGTEGENLVPPGARLSKVFGAEDALEAVVEIFKMMRKGEDLKSFNEYLMRGPLHLAPSYVLLLAGSGGFSHFSTILESPLTSNEELHQQEVKEGLPPVCVSAPLMVKSFKRRLGLLSFPDFDNESLKLRPFFVRSIRSLGTPAYDEPLVLQTVVDRARKSVLQVDLSERGRTLLEQWKHAFDAAKGTSHISTEIDHMTRQNLLLCGITTDFPCVYAQQAAKAVQIVRDVQNNVVTADTSSMTALEYNSAKNTERRIREDNIHMRDSMIEKIIELDRKDGSKPYGAPSSSAQTAIDAVKAYARDNADMPYANEFFLGITKAAYAPNTGFGKK